MSIYLASDGFSILIKAKACEFVTAGFCFLPFRRGGCLFVRDVGVSDWPSAMSAMMPSVVASSAALFSRIAYPLTMISVAVSILTCKG